MEGSPRTKNPSPRERQGIWRKRNLTCPRPVGRCFPEVHTPKRGLGFGPVGNVLKPGSLGYHVAPVRRPRRTTLDIRFELAPMLDVVFILLIFFIFAMVLSKRFTVTDIRLPQAGAASTPAMTGNETIVVSLKPGGELLLNNEPVRMELLADRLAQLQRETPSAKVYLAPDTAASSGELFQLMDTLAKAGMRDVRFLRKSQADSGAAPAQ